jgi:hypothetical protein
LSLWFITVDIFQILWSKFIWKTKCSIFSIALGKSIVNI